MEDYQEKLNKHQDEENRSQNRNSNLSGQYRGGSEYKACEEDGVDFGEVLERREVTQQTAETQARTSNPMKLSYILENSLYLEIDKTCSKCKDVLREEELFTGF